MTKKEILDELSGYTGSFPREAVEAASAMWDEIGTDMVAALEYTAAHPKEAAAKSEYMLHLFAMYLCAERRDRRAFRPLLDILSCPDEGVLDALIGDSLTEDAAALVASVYPGELEPILGLIENPRADEYARAQGVQALVILWAHGMLERQALVEHLGQLMEHRVPREPSYVWNALAWSAADIGAMELLPQVRRIHEEGLADEGDARVEELLQEIEVTFSTDADAVREQIRSDEHRRLIDSAVEAMEWWAAFREPAREPIKPYRPSPEDIATAEALGGTVRRESPRVGRNEPCPCGSGRKYKHCCGR